MRKEGEEGDPAVNPDVVDVVEVEEDFDDDPLADRFEQCCCCSAPPAVATPVVVVFLEGDEEDEDEDDDDDDEGRESGAQEEETLRLLTRDSSELVS